MAKATIATKSVLVAASTLTGKRGVDGRAELLAGGELTSEMQKSLGLDAKAVEELKARGKLVEQKVRAAEGSASVELDAMKARLEKAEGDARKMNAALATAIEENSELAEKVSELEAKLAEATKA